jgi:hypothetical protein
MINKGREVKLPNSKVMRGGVTGSLYSGVYQNLEFTILDNSLSFHFTMPSKGGGNTQVDIWIPPEDLKLLLNEVASNLPDGISARVTFE